MENVLLNTAVAWGFATGFIALLAFTALDFVNDTERTRFIWEYLFNYQYKQCEEFEKTLGRAKGVYYQIRYLDVLSSLK